MTKRVVSLFLSLLMLLTLLPVSALADDGSSASEQPAEVSASTETKKDAEKPAADKASDETNNEKSSDEKTSEESKEKAKTPTYTVKFVAYGKTVAKKTVKEGGTVSSLPHVTLQEETHVFKGWFYKEKGKDIRFTTSTAVSRDLTVEAEIVTDPSSADTESVPASEPSDDDGQKAAPAAQTDGGQNPAPAAADGEGQNPAPAADGEGQNPAPAADGEGQDPAPAANDGEGQNPAPAADGEGQNPEDRKKDDDLTKPDGAILSNDLAKDSYDTKDGKDEPKDVTVTIKGKTWSIDYDGQHHEVATEFDISCDDPDFDTAALKERIIAFLNEVSEKAPVDAGEYATGPDDLKDDQCNDDPKHYHVSYKISQGKLTINKVAVTVSVTGRTETITYDGDSHWMPGYDLKVESDPSGLYDLKDTVIYAKTSTVTNVKRDENGDVTFYVTGFNKPGDWNTNKTNFDVTYEVVRGEFWIMPATLTVTTGSAEDMVDPSSDEYLTCDAATYTGLQGKDEIVGIKCTGAQPLNTVGTADNTFEIVWADEKLANNYTVEANLGTLTVYGENVVIVDIYGGYGEYTYDGQSHTAEGFEAETKHHTYNTENIRYKGEKTLSLTESDAGEYYIELSADDFENLDPEYEVTFVIREDLALIIDPCVVNVLISGKEYEEAYTGSEIVKPAYEILSVESEGSIPFDETKITFKGENAVRGTNPGTYKLPLKEELFSSSDPNFVLKIDYEKLIAAILVITSPKVTINVEGNAFATEFDGTEHVLTVKTDGKAYLDGVEQEEAPFTVTVSVEGDGVSPYTAEDVYVRSDFSIKGTDPGFYDNINWKTHLSLVNPDAEVEWYFANVGPRLIINGEGQGSDLPVVTIRFKNEEVYYLENPEFNFDVEDLPDGESYPAIWRSVLDADGNEVHWPAPVGEYTITGMRALKPVPVGGTVPEDTYTLKFIPAKLTVKPLPVTVSITGENAVLPYTGELQTIEGFTSSVETISELEGLVYLEDFQSFTQISKEAVFEAEGIEPDEYPMHISSHQEWFTCTDPNMDVEYQLTDGKLTIVDADASRYTAELTPVMDGLDEEGKIQYHTRMNYASGVTVSVKDSDGQSVDGFTVDEQELRFIYTNLGTGGGNSADVGSYQVEIDPSSPIVIRDAEGRNVTALFGVTLNPKPYTIIPRQLEIKITGNKAEAHQGTTATATGYTLEETRSGNFFGYLGKYNVDGPIDSGSISNYSSNPWYTPTGAISVTGGPSVGKTFMGLGTTKVFEKNPSRKNWDVTFTYEDGYVEVLDIPAIATINLAMGPSQELTYDGKAHQILPVVEVKAGETKVTLGEMTTESIGGRDNDRCTATMDMTVGEEQYKLSITFNSPIVTIVTESYNGVANSAKSKVVSCEVTVADGTKVTNLFDIQIDSTQSELKINRFPVKLRLRNDHWETMRSRKVVVTDGKEYGEADGSKANWLEIVTPSTPDNLTPEKLLRKNGAYLLSSKKKGTLLTLSREKENELAGQNVGLYAISVNLFQSYNKYDGMMETTEQWIPNGVDRSRTYCYTFEWEIDDDHPNPSATPANYYFQITPAPLSITADDKQKNYGEVDPNLTVSVRGLISGEKLSDDKDFGYDISRFLAGEPEGEKVGAYPITILVWMSAHAGDDPINPPVQKKAARVTEKSVSDRRIDEEERPGVIIPEWPWEDEIDEVEGDPLTGCGHFDHNNYKLTVKDGVLKIYEELTLKGADHEWTYDGAEHSDPDVTLTAGTLSGGADTLTAQATGTIKDPGTAENPVGDDYAITRDGKTTITYTVNKEEHTEPLSDYYTVTTVAGTLTVTKPSEPGAITLTAGNGTKVYDGTALTNPEVKLTSGILLEGDTLTATAGGSAIDVADTAANNNPVISYQIMRGDEDVTAEYTVTTVPGTLTVTPRTITLRSASAAKSYDGTPLRRNVPSRDITIGGQKFAAGEGASYSITGSQTEVGSSRNAFTYKLNANTTAGNYKITTSFGRLRIFDENILDEEVPLGLLGSFSFYFISDTDLAKEGKKNDAYKDIFAWIKENNARLGALAIVGSGNAVLDRNEKAAWKLIKSELANLKRSRNQLPYLNVAGENEVGGDELDYKTYSKNRLCEVSKKNEYNDGQIWYQPFPEQQLLFVGIGYEKLIDPQTATEEEKELQDKWVNAANSMINKYPEYSVVLVLNDFIEHDPASQKDDGRLTEFGKFIEEKLVAPNGNVALVLCGSAEGTARWNKKYGDRNVNAVMYNYQDDEENGLGFFRIITLNGEAGSITVSTYSPTLDKDSYDENNPDYDFYVIHDAF